MIRESELVAGLCTFDTPLMCSSEALGKSYDIEIADISGQLILPSLPMITSHDENPIDKHLVPPQQAANFKRGEAKLYWGRPFNYPPRDSHVEMAYCEFFVPQGSAQKDIAERIYSDYGRWMSHLNKYIQLLTIQRSPATINSQKIPGRFELFCFDSEKSENQYFHNKSTPGIQIRMSSGDGLLHFRELGLATNYASKSLEPRLEYTLLLEAITARRDKDYRKAIIEAANALEVSISTRIKQEFEIQKINFGEALFRKYRMLGGLIELAKILGIPINHDPQSNIINPRNQIMHKALFPKLDDANIAIATVRQLLADLSPTLHA